MKKLFVIAIVLMLLASCIAVGDPAAPSGSGVEKPSWISTFVDHGARCWYSGDGIHCISCAKLPVGSCR